MLEQLDEMGFDIRDKGPANAIDDLQRQTVISQFFQLDRLVVEGQKTVSLLLHVPLKTSLLSTDLPWITTPDIWSRASKQATRGT